MPPADFVLHNSLFLVAHFHNVDHRGRGVRRFRRLHLSGSPRPSASRWMSASARRRSGAGSSAFRSPSCRCYVAGSRRHDAAHAALRSARMASVARGRGARRAHHPVRHRRAGRCSSRSPSAPASDAARAHRGSLERTHSRMVDSPRRRRPSTSPCYRKSQREEPYWDMKQRAREQRASATRRAALRGHRDAAQQSDRLHLRVLRGRHRVLPDLAHLVAGRARTRRRLCHLCGVCLARCRTRSRFRPRKSRGSIAPIAPRAPRRCARRRSMSTPALRARARSLSPRPTAGVDRAAAGDRSRRRRAGAQTHRRRLRLLDLHPLRRDHVLDAFRRLCGARSRTPRGGPGRTSCSTCTIRRSRPACCSLSTFTCGMASLAVGQRSQKWTQLALLVTGLLGLAFIVARGPRVRRASSPAAPARRRSAFLSSFFTLVGCHGVHVTAGAAVARHDDGAVLRQGLSSGHPPSLPVLQPVLACA